MSHEMLHRCLLAILTTVDLQAMQVFTALLALAAAGLALGVVIGRMLRGSVVLIDTVMAAIDDATLWLAFLVTAVATAGSLYFSEAAGLEPCRLCWFQRAAMYPLALITLIAAIRRDRAVRWYAGPLAGVGAAVALYHYVIEWRPDLEGGSCEFGPACADFYFREFGFVTLSFMAFCGFLAVIALTLLTPIGRGLRELDRTPTRPET